MNSVLLSSSGEARLRIMAAKIVAQQRWPYLSTVIFSLKIVPSPDLPTLAVDDGWRMYYNPSFVLEYTAEVLATMVLHEALHCINKHGERYQSLNQQPQSHNLWNLAGDANINQSIDDAKMPWEVVFNADRHEVTRFRRVIRTTLPSRKTSKMWFEIEWLKTYLSRQKRKELEVFQEHYSVGHRNFFNHK